MSLYDVVLQFCFTGTKGPTHVCTKQGSMEELNLFEWHWNANCTPGQSIQQQWSQIPKGTLQNLVEILPRRVDSIITAIGEQLHINVLDFDHFVFLRKKMLVREQLYCCYTVSDNRKWQLLRTLLSTWTKRIPSQHHAIV